MHEGEKKDEERKIEGMKNKEDGRQMNKGEEREEKEGGTEEMEIVEDGKEVHEGEKKRKRRGEEN